VVVPVASLVKERSLEALKEQHFFQRKRNDSDYFHLVKIKK
jgi:hypothetical protein